VRILHLEHYLPESNLQLCNEWWCLYSRPGWSS